MDDFYWQVKNVLDKFHVMRGRDLRGELNWHVPWWFFWRRWSAPAFYLALAKLEDQGLVQVVYGQSTGRTRWYKLTDKTPVISLPAQKK